MPSRRATFDGGIGGEDASSLAERIPLDDLRKSFEIQARLNTKKKSLAKQIFTCDIEDDGIKLKWTRKWSWFVRALVERRINNVSIILYIFTQCCANSLLISTPGLQPEVLQMDWKIRKESHAVRDGYAAVHGT
jgi:hypothetical protein